MSNTVVVAKYKEDTEWTDHLPPGWDVLIVEKEKDVPNIGREAYSYLWAIDQLKPKDDDRLVFCQGEPFVHCRTLHWHLYFEKFDKFTPLGWFKVMCDGDGAPHHPGIPVKETYEEYFGEKFPGRLSFTAGAQFGLRGYSLRSCGPLDRWVELSLTEHGPWLLERYWGKIFGPH